MSFGLGHRTRQLPQLPPLGFRDFLTVTVRPTLLAISKAPINASCSLTECQPVLAFIGSPV